MLKDYAVRNAGPIPQNLWGAPKDLKPYDYNLDKAKERVAKAKAEGAPVDREIEIHIQQQLAQTTQAAQVLQQDLRKIGVNLKIAPNLGPTSCPRRRSPRPRPTCGCTGSRPTSSIRRTGSARCTTASSTAPGRPRAGTRTRRSTSCCGGARLADQAKRQTLYEEASRIVVADAADIWIYNTVQIRGISARVQGFKFSPVGSGAEFRHMSLTAEPQLRLPFDGRAAQCAVAWDTCDAALGRKVASMLTVS